MGFITEIKVDIYPKHTPLKRTIMGNLLYAIAVILILGWLIGFFGFHAGGLIHILLVIAVVAVLLRLIRGTAP